MKSVRADTDARRRRRCGAGDGWPSRDADALPVAGCHVERARAPHRGTRGSVDDGRRRRRWGGAERTNSPKTLRDTWFTRPAPPHRAGADVGSHLTGSAPADAARRFAQVIDVARLAAAAAAAPEQVAEKALVAGNWDAEKPPLRSPAAIAVVDLARVSQEPLPRRQRSFASASRRQVQRAPRNHRLISSSVASRDAEARSRARAPSADDLSCRRSSSPRRELVRTVAVAVTSRLTAPSVG